MEFKGTKGPWRIASRNRVNQFYVIHGKDDEREVQVCKINYGKHPISEQLNITSANAKLIAASPELLEALQLALCDLEYYYEHYPIQGQMLIRSNMDKIKQAINKALK